MVKTEGRYTALYERLSRDDEIQGTSNSILNQKKYLEDYAVQHGFLNIRHFSDDGYTGINFNRPAFNEMLEEIEAGHISTVIVKDMSRFGRNYLQVGFYTEIMFPNKGVRFIAINNNVDSANPMENDFAPFLNIMNEWYAKDTSNKIRAIFRSRMQDGKRCSGSIPYGYTRRPDDKQTLYVDPEAAVVVKRIFEMAADGKAISAIKEALEADRIMNPSAYQMKHHPENSRHANLYDPYEWHPTTIGYILDRQEYIGSAVLGKTILENFKTKKRRRATADELIIFPNTHEPIISEELWEKVQRIRQRKPKKLKNGSYTHRLSGLVFCADCGRQLTFHSSNAVHRDDGKHYDSDEFFSCNNYRNPRYACIGTHYIKASTLEMIIEKAIRSVSRHVLQDEAEFVEQLRTQWEAQQEMISTEERKELRLAEKRIEELDLLVKGTFEAHVLGNLPDRQFQKLMSDYDAEQQQLEERVKALKEISDKGKSKGLKKDSFIALVKKYRDMDEITTPILYDFIEKVVVHQPTGNRYNRQIVVDIHFNFIGPYVVPISPEELAAEKEQAVKTEKVKKERKKAAKEKAEKQRKQKWSDIKEAAKTDPEAARVYEEHLASIRERNRRYKEESEARAAVDPEYAARQAELYRGRLDRQNAKKKAARAALKEKAKTDEAAAQEYSDLLSAEAVVREERRTVQEQRMAEDPEYAEHIATRQKEYDRRHVERRSADLKELKAQAAAGDPNAQEKLDEHRAFYREASKRSRDKLVQAAETDPEAAAKLEAKKQRNREQAKEYYYRKKAEKEAEAV